jgi:orotate phosphoribosyltransferase
LQQVTERSALVRLLASRSVRRGKFILASGRESTHYVDARLTTMSPEGLALIGPLALNAVQKFISSVQNISSAEMSGMDGISNEHLRRPVFMKAGQ